MSIKKSISFTFGSQIINTLIGFVSSVIITRILGAEGRGEFAIFTNSIAFAVLFFGFSLSSTIPYFINSGKAKAGQLLTTLILFMGASTLVVYVSLYLMQQYGVISVALPPSIQTIQFRLIFTGLYFVTLLNAVLTSYLQSYKKFKELSLFAVAVQLFPTLIFVLMYIKVIPYDPGNPFKSVAIAMAIVALVSLLALIFIFVKILPVRLTKELIPLKLVKQFIAFSLMAYIGNVATFFNYRLDYWIIDAYWGKSELGIYSLASQLSQLLWVLPAAISSVLYSYASDCKESEAVSYAVRLKQIAFFGTFILAAIGMLLAYFFIPILYGKEFSRVFGLMKIFMIGVIPYSIPTVLASLFAARGNFKVSFVISILNLAISASFYFILIPKWGSIGGAIGSAVTYLTASVMCELWFCKVYKVSVFNLLKIDKSYLTTSVNIILKKFK